VKSIEQKRIRDTDQGGTGLDHYDDNAKVMVVEIQWVEREVFYLIADKETQRKLQIRPSNITCWPTPRRSRHGCPASR
jgi:hypothetical protein